MDRGLHEGGGFVGNFIFKAVREILRQLIQTIEHQLRGLHFVCPGGQLHAKAGGRVAVVAAEVIVAFRAQFDFRHIAERHQRTVRIHAQRNIAELLRRLQQRLGVNGGIERLIIDRRRTAKLADRDLRIL